MFDEQDRQYFYNEFKSNGYEVGSYDDFKKDLNNEEDRNWYYNEAKNMGYDVGTQADFDKMVLEPAPSTSGGGKQVDASATTQSVGQKASTETKPQVAQPAKKQETTDKEPGLIAKVLDMIPTGVQTSNGTYQPSLEIPQPVVKGEEMPVKEEASSSSANAAPVTTPTGVVNNEGLMDAKLANYIENWKQRPDKQSTYFENMVADLLADGTANSNEEAVNMVMPALRRYANRSAMDVTNQVVSSLPDDTVQDAEQSIGAQWYSHGVQDKLKQEADSMGISYDDYVAHFLKPAMVQSLVNKYGPNYRNIAEGIATRLYSHEENVQERLMNQDINDALSSVINKYVSPSVVDEYNKAQEEGSKAFNEGMEGSQFIPANLRLGTALGAQYEANEAKDPAKVLSGLQQKFGKLYRNPKFLNDMSNAAFKVMQRYGLNGTQSSDPKQFKPMINAAIKNELDQLEIKGMMPKGSAEYIMKTGLGNTIVGKIIRKAVQTDYQNWLEDIANQQYQPGFWENVASGALTFAGDAWSYWLPGAAGGKLTKSMVAKAEGKLAGDLMAKGMERKMAERAAKVLIGKSKAAALKSGAVHGAVTFGGQSAISKPIDETYRTGQFDENGKIYNPSGWKIALDTLLEGGKQSALGVFMQGNTIANMIGKGRGLATNILADVGGKVVDSGIMTGHQILERMAQDPNFKPTGKDAAESFLESMANLTAIGLPGMMGKYARFKDAREFNKKFDFTDQDIAELKRFGYDGLRDAFEKVSINGYRAEEDSSNSTNRTKLPVPYAEETQVLNLTQKYMDLMNDKSVPEVLKAKMMAVVEGKRPSSFSPVVDSVIVQPMDQDGKVYLETLNKDGGIIDRKEFSSLDEAQKADKKLEYEKTLGLASVLEGEFHNEFTQEHLEDLYNQAAQKYYIGYKLTDEEKAAVYLRQNAGTIDELIHNRQNGIILTDEEQKQLDTYRHFYDSALENSSVLREFVQTFEDSHGVARGTLRKALESKDKKYAPLVESYLKELYNSIELKREMKDTKEQMNQTEETQATTGSTQEGGASAQNAEATAEKPVDASVSSDVPPTEPPTPPVGGETPSNADDTPSVENNVSPSDADTASNESKSDAFVMGQNAYKNGDSEALQAIDYNSDLATGRLMRAFADNEKMPDIVANAYNEGRDMEQFVAQRASSLTPAQKEAISKYVEAMDAKKGAIDALQHADDGYGDALKEQLWPYQTEDGNIVPATLDSGKQVFLKKDNEYGGAFVVVPDEQGLPTIKQVSKASIIEKGTPVPLDEYIENAVAQQKDARNKQFISQFDGSGLKPNDRVTLAIEEGDDNIDMTFAGYSEDGKIVLTDGKDYLPLSKEEFAAWRKNALDNTINEHLDAEDDEREQKAVSQAEADKKQRYANGIVGLSEGQPDYSSKDTDPNVAAEYLQEQFGEDHGKLLNLVNGSRDDIETQLANKKKAAAEYQNWLDTNADLDPEKAKKVEDELSLVNEQIADLDARFKNWNTIRNSVMTPDELRTMKEERKAEIERAGIDKSSVLPDVDTGVRIPENSELKDKYPTQEAASGYITSERRRVYKMQEETQREIDGVDKILNQYMDGGMELSAEQLRDLNTTKAELANRQNALTADAKALKGKAESLNILYIKERAEQNKKNLEALSPKDRRKELVAKALEKKDMKAIKEIYKDASTDVMDLTPRTLEEFVSERLFPHSLNAESLAQELGSSNFRRGIGSKYDTNKYNYLLANNGEGLTISELAKRVWEDLSSTMESGAGDGLQSTYSDQDVRNAILDMFKTYDSVREMRNVTLLNRIAAAENELSGEEEWYEQQKEREIFEKQKEIDEYQSYIHDKELSLPSESELDYINGLEFDRMMEIEDREREYKQYVKSILPELADYDDRSNEEGYGGGSSLGSDSSRRGVDEGNSQGEEVGNGEASSESEIGEGSDSGRKGRQETGSMEPGEGPAVRGSHLPQEASFGERLKSAIAETETEPTEAQKKAGNYKKGHLSFGGYDYTVETPKGVTRSGKDEQGKPWSVTMHDTYGYILGKIGVDGDHIDMFINDDADLDSFDGNVCVVDQVNPETGEFDEHKVMYGYPSEEAATEAYLANYSKGWKGLGKVTSVPKSTFDKWLESSDRKTKPFAEYAMVQKEQAKFDRDVKEVEPSEMTEAQKVAYDAVSTMLKKAGIPVKVVSNEDMEKVADVIINDMFKGKNITMPSNVVTPSLRKELEKRGVPFVETDNRGRIVGGENDGVQYSKVYGKKANVKPRLGSATISLKAAKDKVVELFNKAKNGEFNGKPQSIGTLTQEGKKFLEDLSGLKMKDKIDFVLNPSDLKHMNKDHFGDNEKDPGRNIPLTEEDLRSMVDVIMNPEQVVYGIEKMDNRKVFFFLKQAEDGTLNLAEIYSDKKGNLTAKSYYKTKKGVDQRVMEIKNSLLPTPEASSGSPLSDGKGINFFSIEQEKTAENERKIADSVVNTANKLGGAEATVYFSLDDVPEEYRSEVEQGAKGWYDPETHSVHVYLPNCEDGNDAQRTVFHEKIGHEGMEVLLGGEDGVRKFANFVYRSVGKDVRGKIIDFANKYDPDWKNPDRMNVGTQEYIAHLAEEGPKTAEDFSLWTKIKHYLIKVLKKLGVRVPGLLNDKDLRYYLMKAGKALHVWDNMPKEKQEAMMKQASNAEIKDALSDGANLPSEEDNKPKKKTERGRIDEATGAFKLAPNGEQSNLSKKQYIEARTKNFKDWFGGDWEKKPKDFKNKLDANGEPLEKYVEGYLNRPKKPTMPKKRKGEGVVTFFGRKMLYSQALEDWPKTEADWKKRIDEFDENTLAALTPPDEEAIREKYQKQYENDMASWRKDHPKIKEGEERPLKIPDMRDYQSIQDYGEALGKHEIWKTAPNKDEYERMAEDEIISKVALMDAVQHPFSEYARLKTMKAEFQHMRHVMQNQKVYDQNTTDAVVQFAKRFMSLGYGDDLGRGSINTLLTIVKNSTGKKSYEISQHLYQVMDVLMNNQLRNFDRAVMKTMSIKELRENAKGIQVQGKLELRGQTTIKAFRDAVSSRISSDKLDEKISNLIDKMAADKKNASSYQDELLGLNLAKQYVDYIDSSRNDAIEIEDMKRMEIEGYKNRKGIYEGELTKALLQEHVERLNQYDDALFNNKVERMERYSQLLANLGGMIDESVKGAREFQERDARRAIKVKMMASADLDGKSMNQHHKENWKTRLSNSDVVRLFCSPLGSFDALMREFGSKQINGEGQLWNHFVRGAMKASNDAFKSVREANNEIDLKVSELFGKVTEDKNGNKKGNMTLNDLYALERSNKVKSLDVTIRDIEGEQTYKLQQGNLMYIYMVNKMPDGAMKLRQMGILDADVERIKENIDPRFLKLADWIQGEFLPKMRTKYNKRHEELFGAPMPMVENYFPLRVLKNARYVEEDVNNTSDGSNALPSTATGAIIKRKINKLPLDILNADALSVTIDNINEMENWYNYAPIRKDANTLLSDTAFRNRVQNMTTIYGSGERLWNNVKDATAVAMGTYRPKGGTDLAVSIKNIGKGITGAKISGRLYTAFKQILSFPLFLADADLGRFVRHSVHPYGSFKWAIENMPNFDKRWSGRKLGDTVLMDDPTDWKLWHTNLMEKAAYYGMTPNALVDAVTCAVGARAVYDTKYKQYIKAGLTEERAKEKALSDAEINFNTSQQSSEGAFVSPMQLDRTLESAIFTPFRNSSMLYERKGINALRNLKHRFEKGHKEASIKYMAAQLMEEGVEYEQATKAAEKMYKKGLMHNIADAIVALWLGPIIWNLGGNLGYLIPYLGDDENKKKKMVIDAVILGLLEGPVDGLAGGQFINTAIANTITSDGISLKGLKNVDFSGMPMLSDFNSMIEKFGYDKVAGAQDLMFMVMQSATGFNPKTLTDAINACIDYGNGDMTNAKEIALFVFRLMNGPAATVDNLYIDELGMKGKDAKKLSYEELAKRYAEYKFGKNTFGLGKLYSDEEKQKKLKAIEKSFDKKVSERLAGMDREDLKNEFSESRSQKEKKLIGKIIADELETKDSEAVKKAKADASYLRQRNFSDLMDDLYLQKEWETTNAANAGLEELKDNGASEEEIEAYKTKHKAALDKRKAIQKARKEMQKKKADISSDNDEATMAAIRKLRDSILKTVRQKKK
jgi:hypothetical protein